MKEIILIGGKFHRKKINVEDHQYSINMRLPQNYSAQTINDPLKNPMFTPSDLIAVYSAVDCIFGEYGIIPRNVFLEVGADPVEWLKHLVLDYVR